MRRQYRERETVGPGALRGIGGGGGRGGEGKGVPPGPIGSHPGPPGSHFFRTGPTPRLGSKNHTATWDPCTVCLTTDLSLAVWSRSFSKRGRQLPVAWKSVIRKTNARLRRLVATRDCRHDSQLQEPQKRYRCWKL